MRGSREWEKAGDERMWRVIVSPEDADRMDLKGHVRELVRAMEADLGTRLEWVAIDHHNTDNPHVHLLVRGVDERGKALMIDREYVRTGIRARSQEIASRELGQRLEPEMLRARGETIGKERWTEIDRALQRRADGDRVVDYSGVLPYNDAARVRAEQEMQRLPVPRRAWAGAPAGHPCVGTVARPRAGTAQPPARDGCHQAPGGGEQGALFERAGRRAGRGDGEFGDEGRLPGPLCRLLRGRRWSPLRGPATGQLGNCGAYRHATISEPVRSTRRSRADRSGTSRKGAIADAVVRGADAMAEQRPYRAPGPPRCGCSR